MRSVMTLLLCLLFASASLTACGTLPAKDASQGSDLDVLVLGVKTLLGKREPAGTVKRAEDAQTVEQVWELTLDLEDVDWLHEQDKARAIDFTEKAAERIKASRRTCTRWDRLFNRRECL